ncbi:glutamate racemase [Patescibacteria group bacterium]|nr:glutamate racemase [Patescibacteria group bacterium]
MLSKSNSSLPIGVFDSGVGGLTVIKSLLKVLPHEDFIYLGDTARTPYGSRSAETIKRYTQEDINFLLRQRVKLIICACNTASAIGLNDLPKEITTPVMGVINPMIAIVKENATSNATIGILGTRATINSRAYQSKLKTALPKARIFDIACPLLVPLIEENWIANSATRDVLKTYLTPLIKSSPEILILGCTHYPLLKKEIAKLLPKTLILDSGNALAKSVKALLTTNQLINSQKQPGKIKFFVTDSSTQFNSVAKIFLPNISNIKAKQIIL